MNKKQKALLVATGMAIMAGVFIVYHLLVYGATKQTKLSCHSLNPTITKTEYCVYYSTAPGLLGDTYTLLIGPSAGRGLEYKVPYEAKDITVSWDKETDLLNINMPGSKLSVEPREYVDTR